MIKGITIGILSAIFAFFVAVSFVSAQTSTPYPTSSPTMSPTPTPTSTTPGAPNTGF